MEDTRQPLAELTRGDWLAFDSLLLESGMANDWIAEDGAGGVLVESFTLRGDDGDAGREVLLFSSPPPLLFLSSLLQLIVFFNKMI